MSEQHGPIVLKPINDIAQLIKNLIPTNVPDYYAIKPRFYSIASEEAIRNGVIAYRNFLFLFYDRLSSDGHLYVKLPKKPKISEIKLEILYPSSPSLLIGLKAMAIADIELRAKKYMNDNNHHNLLRCDYRLLKAEDSNILDMLKDFLRPLPENVQKLALELHQHYVDLGMTCVAQITTFEVHFSYAYIKNCKRVLSTKDIYQKRIWEFALNVRNGYCLVVKTKKTDKYADDIEKFSPYLQEKIANGYGCDRKLRNEACQCGCQGIRIPLDETILNISKDIVVWLDSELSCLK